MSMNPFDKHAVEAAVRLVEAGAADRNRRRLDRPQAVDRRHPHRPRHGRPSRHPGRDRRPHRNPRHRQAAARPSSPRKSPTSCCSASRPSDDDSNHVGQMLAAPDSIWPQATFASEIKVVGTAASRSPARSTAGRATVSIPLPAVVTADLRLNDAAQRRPAHGDEGPFQAAGRPPRCRLRHRRNAPPHGRKSHPRPPSVPAGKTGSARPHELIAAFMVRTVGQMEAL